MIYDRNMLNVGDTVYCVKSGSSVPVPMTIFSIQELPHCNGVSYCLTLKDGDGNIHSPDCEKLEVFKTFVDADRAINAMQAVKNPGVEVDYIIEFGTTKNSYPEVNCFAPAIVMTTRCSPVIACTSIKSLDEAKAKFKEMIADFGNIIRIKSDANKAAWASEGICDVDDFNAIFLSERTVVNSRASLKLIVAYSET